MQHRRVMMCLYRSCDAASGPSQELITAAATWHPRTSCDGAGSAGSLLLVLDNFLDWTRFIVCTCQ